MMLIADLLEHAIKPLLILAVSLTALNVFRLPERLLNPQPSLVTGSPDRSLLLRFQTAPVFVDAWVNNQTTDRNPVCPVWSRRRSDKQNARAAVCNSL